MIGFPFDSQVTYEADGTPVYDRAISSEPLRQLIKKLFTTGILPNPSTNLQVQAGTGMNVIVNPGFAVIEGGLKYEETLRTLAVQASDATYDRIDTVVMRWNDNTNARSCDLYVIQGSPAVSPVRPALNREGSVYEIGLADLFIAANSSAISTARITDTRYEAERCGIISAIAEFDSDTIYAQVQADLAGFKAEEQAEFIAWFENIKTQLSGDAAGNLQLQIDDLKTSDTKDNTISFESGDVEEAEAFTEVALLASGEKHASLLAKVSLMFKNIRRLIKLVGTTDISAIEDGTLTGIAKSLNSKLLWENSNPTSTFGAQTITIENMNKYKFLLFELRCYTNIANRFTGIVANNGIDAILSVSSTYANQAGGVIYRRDVCRDGDSVIFRNGYRQLGTSETQDDGCAIPVRVYGIN